MKNTDLEFIRLKSDDLEELINISRKTFYDAYANMNTLKNMQDYMGIAFNRNQIKKELGSIDSEFYFVKRKKEILGYLKINFGKAQSVPRKINGLEIERIYVLKGFQGQRIGSSMIDFTTAQAKDRNLEYVWLGVWMKNAKAIEFYEKNGFKIIESHPFKLGDDMQTDYIMRRNTALVSNNINT